MTEYISLVHNLILFKMENEELNLDSKEALRNVLQECEIHMKVIEQQLAMCQVDHRTLQEEMTRLVTENSTLFAQLKAATESKVMAAERSSFKTYESEAISNLQDQLSAALDEKQLVENLWKTSLEKISALEEKLQDYQSGHLLITAQNKLKDKDYSEAIQILESQLTAAKKENEQLTMKCQMLESQLMQVTSQMALISKSNLQLNDTLKEVTTKEQELLSQHVALQAKCSELERRYQADKVKFARIYEYERVEDQLKEKLEAALRQRDDLQETVERCQERTAELLRNAASDRSKIEEAVALVDGALQSRDEVMAREAASAEEIKRLRSEVSLLLEDSGRRVERETSAVREKYEDQMSAIRSQLEVKEQECLRKSAEVLQYQHEYEKLQLSLDQSKTRIPPSRRDKHLNKVYSELHHTESECLQLRVENESLKESLSRLQEKCSKSSREKTKLKQELTRTQQQLQMCQHELSVIVQRAELLNSQLQQTDLELARLQSESLLAGRSCGVSNAESKLTVASTLELYKQFDESYGKMTNMWKNEMNTMAERFENKIKKLKEKVKRYTWNEEPTQINNNKSEEHL